MYDIIIKNGTVVDGSGAPGFRADVGLTADRIEAVGELEASAKRILDADGCVVCPGFIDMHSHTDESVIANRTCESKLTQGVTTEVSGNCGYSAAPFGGQQTEFDETAKWLSEHGVDELWTSMDGFFSTLDGIPMSINFATFVGHGTIRAFVLGYEDRAPSADELAEMKKIAAESVRDGAFGVSSGLIYPPACFAKTDELVALCAATAQYGGIYSTHMRNEAERLLAAVEEAIGIGRDAGVGVQISHHKACGVKNWGLVHDSLAMIDRARAEGLDVWADQYPYVATSTSLGIMVPQWVHDGGRSAFLSRLRNPETRAKIRDEMVRGMETGYLADSGGWETVVVSSVKNESNFFCEGLSVQEIAVKTGKHPVDACLDLLLEEGGGVGMMHFVISEDDLKTVLKHPAVVVGTDATARSMSGWKGHGKAHPRAYGTFPRILKKYVREEGVLSLEEAVAKMSGCPAKRLGLNQRGFVTKGYYADLVVFDPAKVADTATFTDSMHNAVGIPYVLVNGQVACEDGKAAEPVGQGSGRVLRRGA